MPQLPNTWASAVQLRAHAVSRTQRTLSAISPAKETETRRRRLGERHPLQPRRVVNVSARAAALDLSPQVNAAAGTLDRHAMLR